MNPYIHSQNSARRYGGIPEDYLKIHQWFDQCKAHIGDIRHRLILHNSWGVSLCEQSFGDFVKMPNVTYVRQPFITNTDACQVMVRDIAQDHVREDMFNTIPSLSDQFKSITTEMVAGQLGVFGAIRRKVLAEVSEKL